MTVVIFIIAVLATIFVISGDYARKKARDSKRIADLNTVSSALMAYYADNHHYPGGAWMAGWGSIGEAGQYPSSKCMWVQILKGYDGLNTGGYLHSCPQEASIKFRDCYQWASTVGACGGVANHETATINDNVWGYRYTCFTAAGPPNFAGDTDCIHFMIGTHVEIEQNATTTSGPTGVEYRMCDGEPDYGNSRCNPATPP